MIKRRSKSKQGKKNTRLFRLLPVHIRHIQTKNRSETSYRDPRVFRFFKYSRYGRTSIRLADVYTRYLQIHNRLKTSHRA